MMVVPRLFVEVAVVMFGILAAVALVQVATYWFAAQHGYTVAVTLNNYGEFWAELYMFVAVVVACALLILWGDRLVRRDAKLP
jgi:hypothetical protein